MSQLTRIGGLGDYPFGDYPFGIGGPAPAGRRINRKAASWSALPRIYRADITGTRIDDITPARARSVSASYNEDFETKRQASFDVVYPDELRDLEDFVAVDLDITRDDGLEMTLQLGNYIVMGRSVTMTNTMRQGVLNGRDLTWLLRQATIPGLYVVSTAVDPGAAARDILFDFGIPSELINIPDAGVTLTRDLPSKPGEDWLSFLTDLLAAGAMYQPWVASDHRITSRRVIDIATEPAVHRYHTADGAKVIPGVVNDPDLSKLRNRVTVRKVSPTDGESIHYTATVTDVGSPIHPERLQERLGLRKPVILGVAYDEHNITSEGDARLLAESRLSELGSYYDKVKLATYPDQAIDGHLIMDLDLMHQGQHYYTGRWWQRTWDVRLDGPVVTIQRELTRTVQWQ